MEHVTLRPLHSGSWIAWGWGVSGTHSTDLKAEPLYLANIYFPLSISQATPFPSGPLGCDNNQFSAVTQLLGSGPAQQAVLPPPFPLYESLSTEAPEEK